MKKLFSQIKYSIAEFINGNPYLMFFAWQLLPHLPFLLPHDKSFFAFRHLASNDNGLFLDVGANKGISALSFRCFNSSYRILSIEPNPKHEPSLKRLKSKLNNFDYRIIGAGDHNSRMSLYTPLYNKLPLHALTSFSLEYVKETVEHYFPKRYLDNISYLEETVDVIRLDELQLEPSIIKIDTEGFDYKVLLGLRNTIKISRPSIMFEYNSMLIEKLEKFFQELSYSLFVYEPDPDRFVPFNAKHAHKMWRGGKLNVNPFCLPSEKVAGLSSIVQTTSTD